MYAIVYNVMYIGVINTRYDLLFLNTHTIILCYYYFINIFVEVIRRYTRSRAHVV